MTRTGESKGQPAKASYAGKQDPKKRVPFLRPSKRIGLTVSGGPQAVARALYRLLPSQVNPPEFLPLERLGLDPSGAPAPIPAIDDFTSIPPPNLYVAFILERLEHAVVAGDGVPQSWVWWQGSSPDITDEENELSGPFLLPLPPAGEVWPYPSDHGNAIYQGLELDGCSSATLSFPVTLESWVNEEEGFLPEGAEIGRVTLTDEETLTHGGWYDFHYVIRCEGTNGGASDFTISGGVYVHCTDASGL